MLSNNISEQCLPIDTFLSLLDKYNNHPFSSITSFETHPTHHFFKFYQLPVACSDSKTALTRCTHHVCQHHTPWYLPRQLSQRHASCQICIYLMTRGQTWSSSFLEVGINLHIQTKPYLPCQFYGRCKLFDTLPNLQFEFSIDSLAASQIVSIYLYARFVSWQYSNRLLFYCAIFGDFLVVPPII